MSAARLMIPNDDGVFEIVALSGGKDSTDLAFELRERFPSRIYNYICTPTGDEPAAMFAHWRNLGDRLGRHIVPIVATWISADGKLVGGLDAAIEHERTIPNRRLRYCTRKLKIEPYRAFLKELTARGPVISHVGLRADEEGRAGGAYGDIAGVTMRFLLRELGKGEAEVVAANEARGIAIPERTDCRKCYAQQIGEWYRLWRDDLAAFMDAENYEKRYGRTFREPKLTPAATPGNAVEAVYATRYGFTFAASSRDTWPARLADLRAMFEDGVVPPTAQKQSDMFRSGSCRVCSL